MKGQKELVSEITPKSADLSRWYTDVVRKAELADYAPVRGCMVIRPYGFRVWELIRDKLDSIFKDTGHQNAYFPLFIPESLLTREAEHVEGFSPEVAWVTQGGKEPLEERLAIRPTSEAIIGVMYARWIQTYRDLPVLINQWANVVRWEKVTRPFLRTTEFLWQEGHTAHRTHEEASEEVFRMLDIYRTFVEEDLSIPVYFGAKTAKEKFAGALRTFSIEALMPDGQALQSGTSHDLGQNFAKAFDIAFLDSDGERKLVWTTSWGMSTRIMGALIMVHGDDRGLVLPPKVAPYQAVVVPIFFKDSERILARARELTQRLGSRFRVFLDDRREHTPGWKFNEWEMRGVPIRVELGPRDLDAGQATVVRRDTYVKEAVALEALEGRIEELLREIQANLLVKATELRDQRTFDASSLEGIREVVNVKRSFARVHWCGSAECEARIKEEMGATIRCLPLNDTSTGPCAVCGQGEGAVAYVARAY